MSSDCPTFEQRTKDVIVRVEPEFLAAVSYTHLTLPTTPYV